MSVLEYFFGIPTEINDTLGLIPFADRSLTQAETLFRETCHTFIPGGTSVLSTSMSHLRMRLFIAFRWGERNAKIDTSSSFCLIPLGATLETIISIICFS